MNKLEILKRLKNIEEYQKAIDTEIKLLKEELFGDDVQTFSSDTEDYNFELCFLHRDIYQDRMCQWHEDSFVPCQLEYGMNAFNTFEDALAYVKKYNIEFHQKVYIHNMKHNTYKRVRSNGLGEYYVK